LIEKPSSAPPRRRRLRRLVRWGIFLITGLVLLLGGFLLWVWLTCFAVPPELAERPAILGEIPGQGPDGRLQLGKSWFKKDPGCSLLYLEGDPFTLGYANGVLTGEFVKVQEEALLDTVRTFFPSRASFFAIGLVVLVNNRNLPSYVPLEYQVEILGISLGSPDSFPQYGPRYHRILNYHAAHDISHWVLDRPVLGCTAVAAGGPWTRDGRLLVGRNFDFEGGRHFDENKLVVLCRPQGGRAFISVAWPGMAGAVTGFNEDRLYCSINGAHSSDRANIGTPVSLVVRMVLQQAGTLEEGIGIIREAKVFVSDSYLLADGRTGRAVSVEKSPGRTEVREMQDGVLFQANHFESPGFAGDARNLEARREGTTAARRERIEELVVRERGKLDVEGVARVLRDRRGPGDRELAPGNRAAINPMIATHSVVADLATGTLWISRGPHQLGRYDAVSFEKFGEAAAAPIPEDEALASGLYERLRRSRALFADLEKEAGGSPILPATAEEKLRQAMELNPGDPVLIRIHARHLEASGRKGDALGEFRKALQGSPAFPAERKAIEQEILRLESQDGAVRSPGSHPPAARTALPPTVPGFFGEEPG
jgi:isopenicillin-N N-acyltransferase-like protein